MGQTRTILFGMAAVGVIAILVAVIVPMSVLVARDRGAGEPPVFASPTPVLVGSSQGSGVLSPIPTSIPDETPQTKLKPTTLPHSTSAAASTASNETPGNAEMGKEVFETASPISCQTCHSLDGTTGLGPSLGGIATLGAERIQGTSASDYIRQSILNPGFFVLDGYTDGLMPSNFADTLSTDDVTNLVKFLLDQEQIDSY